MAFKECLIAWTLFAGHSWHGRTCFLSSVLPARCQCLLSLSSSPLVKCKWWWVLPLANTPNQYMKYYFLQKYSYFPKEDTATLLTGEAFQGTKNRIKKCFVGHEQSFSIFLLILLFLPLPLLFLLDYWEFIWDLIFFDSKVIEGAIGQVSYRGIKLAHLCIFRGSDWERQKKESLACQARTDGSELEFWLESKSPWN